MLWRKKKQKQLIQQSNPIPFHLRRRPWSIQQLLILGNLDFENLSLSLYKAWNRISDDADDDVGDGGVALATASTAPPRHNQSELEAILVRVGVQDHIAGKVADEVFEKLGRTRDEAITFDDFVSLIQSDVTPIQYRCTNDGDDDDTDNDANSHDILRHCDIIADLPVTTISSLDMHAPHTGLFP